MTNKTSKIKSSASKFVKNHRLKLSGGLIVAMFAIFAGFDFECGIKQGKFNCYTTFKGDEVPLNPLGKVGK